HVFHLPAAGRRRRKQVLRFAQDDKFCWGVLYLAPISAVAFDNTSNDLSGGNCAARLRRDSITVSVGIFPTRSSCAKGHPPRPPMAESKRRHPASKAATILAAAWSGRLCRWTPISR